MTPLSIFSVNLLSEDLLLIASILIFAAVLVAKAGSKLGAPSLLLFLILGMLAGPDVLGLHFRDLHLPHGIRVMMVRREEHFLVPHGSMPLEVGDHLVIIVGESDD